MKKIIALLFFLLAAVAVVFIIFHPSFKKTPPPPKISNFQECAAAGYPVMDSYPRQCTLPNGNFFVEQTVPER